ncbi:hypothetical protein Q8F55_000775 [Vanrija albida]|uniref:Uncharacterized protein n=1 Tax=Vanrija albida TaxID=181172 RepID=A0ABR3QF82_9TREE
MSKPSNFNALVARLARMTSSPNGLDSSLMIGQYGGPLAAGTILAVLQWLKTHGKAAAADQPRLVSLAAGLVRMGGAIGSARVVTRLFGLLPMIDWLLKLYPQPVKALIGLLLHPSRFSLDIRNERVYATIRIIALCGYYVGEHTAWLASQGVLQLQPATVSKIAVWSVRSWAVDVVLSCIQLFRKYLGLRAREKALKASAKSEEKTTLEDQKAARAQLTADWAAWEQQAVVNYGYLPLTVHWSTPGGVWTSPLITAAIGSVVSVGKLAGAWAASA